MSKLRIKKTLLGGLPALLMAGVLWMQVAPASASDHSHHGKEYAKFNKAGELVRPADYREWIFVGSP